MKRLTVEQIAAAVSGTLIQGEPKNMIAGVSTDSRRVNAGELFIPLIEDQHDAHDSIPQVIERGCSMLILSKKPEEIMIHGRALSECSTEEKPLDLIQVDNTAKALRDLASFYLSLLPVKKIGVTGSTGKTTTKEMLSCIFSEKYKTAINKDNLNNQIGLSLMVLSLPEDTEAGIFEMGMSGLGENDLLAELVRPDVGVITDIDIARIENLGSRQSILKAKMEITNYFSNEGILIVNEDHDFLSREDVSGDYHVITTGETGRSNFIVSGIVDHGEDGIEFSIEHKQEIQAFQLKVPGRHNAYNAALAIAAAACCGITMKEAAAGLLKLEITDKRLNIKGKNGMKVIDDTYDTSPDTMKEAIDILISTKGFRKIAILADMYGLGEDLDSLHNEAGRYAAESGVDHVFAVGAHAEHIAEAAARIMGEDKVHYYETKELLMNDIGSMISSGDVILVKGSRDMAMEQVVKKIME